MPLYEYRCGSCGEQFEVMQPVSTKAEETACPRCHVRNATRLMSSFASKIVGDHKPGFKEMKAYNMLNERMDKFSKLPPAFGKRGIVPAPENFGSAAPHGPKTEGGGNES